MSSLLQRQFRKFRLEFSTSFYGSEIFLFGGNCRCGLSKPFVVVRAHKINPSQITCRSSSVKAARMIIWTNFCCGPFFKGPSYEKVKVIIWNWDSIQVFYQNTYVHPSSIARSLGETTFPTLLVELFPLGNR